MIVERVECDSCANLRYCLRRGAVTQCVACAIGDILPLLRGIADDLEALRVATSRSGETKGPVASPRRCVICKKNAIGKKNAAPLDLPHWENMCALCVTEAIRGWLEFIQKELKTVLQTCEGCGQPAEYLWENQLPLCGGCAESEGLTVEQEDGPGGESPPGFSVSPSPAERSRGEGAPGKEW